MKELSNLNLVTFNAEQKKESFYASHKNKTRHKTTHWHDFYEIQLITQGTITECINGHKTEMGPGWIYFLKPYDVHEYWANEPVSMYKIQFLVDILDSDIQKALISDQYRLIMKLPDDEYQFLAQILETIVKEYNSHKPNRIKMIGHLMNCLSIEMIRLCKNQNSNTPNSDSIFMALEYIHHNYTKNITMQQVANHVGLTPNYFCSKFHKEIGQSFKQYLRSLQLNHAATLLRISDISISNACNESGMSSFAHFLRDFKAYYGMTPSQYRKQMNPKI